MRWQSLPLFQPPPLAHSETHYNPYDVYNGSGVILFKKHEITSKNGFRIPAIAAGNGILIAGADARYAGEADIVAGNGLYKAKLVTKISYDGGLTWSDITIHNSSENVGDDDYFSLASDPALVFDEKTQTTLMFGLRNNVNLFTGTLATDANNAIINEPNAQNTAFIMFRSKDGGKSWESKDIHKELLDQVNAHTTNKKFSIVFQGPGGGMTYKGKIYIPIQAWATQKDTGTENTTKTTVATSGFMVSEDGGDTWTASSMLINSVDAKLAGTDQTINTSESTVFYHKGKIRIAVKDESGLNPVKNGKKRRAFEYDETSKKWTEVAEDFIPQNVSQCETSTHSLSEDVYLAAYVTDGRVTPTLASNTGVKLPIAVGGNGLGYTSISSDDNNIYVLYEGVLKDRASLGFKAIDWKHKEYASLNTQIRDRANTMNYMQSKFASESGYMSGKYGSDDAGFEIVGAANGLKGGIFVKNSRDINKDNMSVAEYDSFDVALLVGLDQSFASNIKGTMMLGYMNSALDYANGSENDVSSLVGGYRLQLDTDYVGLRSGISYMYSRNDIRRNRNEGLGKTADFDSMSFSISNELFKSFDLNDFGDLELAGGMVNTFFKHDGFREVGGEGTDENGTLGANNATLRSPTLQSHELFIKAAWDSKPIALCDYANLSFNTDLKYAIDVADTDKWKEQYRTFSVERTYEDIGELYSARDGGFFTAQVGANLEILKQINIGLKGVADNRGEYSANVEAKISI